MMRIGKIPYLNSVLFYHELEAGAKQMSFESLVPRQLSGAAVEHGVDAGPVPLVTCWDIEDRYESLGDFCIATIAKARSIFLFSKRPFGELTGATIGVTGETSTSVRLLKVLMTHVYRVEPRRYEHLDWPANDAFLLIGDEALLHRAGVKGYPYFADLGEVWNTWTGLPFVFARWIVRKDLEASDKKRLVKAIEASIEYGWKHFEEVVAPKVKELSMPLAEIREYMEGFRFKMTEQEHEAVVRFRQLDAAVRRSGAGAATAATLGGDKR